MNRIILLFFFCVALVLSFSQQKEKSPSKLSEDFQAVERIFAQAESLADRANYSEKEEDRLYRLALAAYERLIPALQGHDSLQFLAFIRAGLIHYYLDSPEGSKTHYRFAMALKEKIRSVPDSLLFKPYLYTGGIFYLQNLLDSAFIAYKKAETILEKYSGSLEEAERLYNRLGVMYYETGNYRLARNYFEKAVSTLHAGGNIDLSLLVNYKINIASLLIKLEEYDEANRLYQSILPYGQYGNEIYHNLGIIELRIGRYEKAASYFRKVNYGDHKRNIDLFYNLAMVHSGLGRRDSVDFFLNKAIAENNRWNGNRKNIPFGLILKLKAEELNKKGLTGESLAAYQEALSQFHLAFDEKDIFSNPVEFTGIFSYLNLFNTLAEKAEVFVGWFRQSGNSKHLKAALDAYRSAFLLAGYVERNYESDEARLFLNRIKHTVHDRPIAISLELHELTGDNSYLEDAYYFDQVNKASALVLNMQEAQLRNLLPASSELFSRETSLKNELARLTLRSSQVTDSAELKKLTLEIRDKEIELSRIQDKMIDDPLYRERHFTQYIPATKELFNILDDRSAIISYHQSEKQVLALVITRGKMRYHKIAVTPRFFQMLDSLKNYLREEDVTGGPVQASTHELYKILVAPLARSIEGKDRLIIIPDDDLHYLPFEALRDEQGNYLLHRFAIQYQYSTPLLLLSGGKEKLSSQLAFAPFAARGYTDSSNLSFSKLPASGDEVKDIRGRVLRDEDASKENFLKYAGRSGIIHLATHAKVDNDEPMRSFIAFSPRASRSDYRLYAGEIYTMRLDSTDLVILSACETGSGRLIKGEGLMSLSRAFAYAGCPNIITSLWKAEDKTTAYIGNRLHLYLDKGLPKDEALRKAKLDLLADDQVDPRFKAPRYWAHLLFIGSYQKKAKTSPWAWIGGGLAIALLTIYILSRRKRLATSQSLLLP